jgi:Xaa-Pro aminopeptidase
MDLAQRRAAVLRRMAQDNIDLLIAASSGFRPFDWPDPVTFLSGYQSLGESLFLLRSDGAATLIVSPAWDAERVQAGAPTLNPMAADDVAAALTRVLSERRRGRIAMAGYGAIAPRLAAQIASIATPALCDFDQALYAACGRKTDAEIENARKATRIAERGFERLIEVARPGLPECDLAVELNLTMKALGADDNFMILSAAPHARGIMPSSTRRLQAGDILLAEFTPGVGGQFIQTCRTTAIGPPSTDLVRKYDLVVRAMWAGIEAVRPGVPIAQVCRAIDDVLADAGFAEYCRPPHIRRRGHGFGLGSTSPGDVALDNDTVLKEDMLFVVHPNQYLPGPGYLLCGEPVRVTANGVEVLSQTTAALGVIRR